MKISLITIFKTVQVFIVLFIQQLSIVLMSRNSFDEYVASQLKRVQMNIRQALSNEKILDTLNNNDFNTYLTLEDQLTITKNQTRASFDMQFTDMYIQYNTPPNTGWSILQATNYSTPYQQISNYFYDQTEYKQTVFEFNKPINNLDGEKIIELIVPINLDNDNYIVQMGMSILYNDFIMKSDEVQFSFYLFLILGIIIIGQLYFIIITNISKKTLLKEKIEQLQIARETMFDSWWEVDRTIKLVDASNNFYQTLEYSKDEIIGKYFQEFLTQEENTRVNGGLRLLLTQKQPFRHFRNQRETKNGEIKTFLTTGFPKINENGQLIGFYCYDYDITNIEQLKNKSLLFRAQYFQYPQPMIIVDREFNIKYVNQQFTKKFNLKQNQVQNKHIDQFIQNEKQNAIKNKILSYVSKDEQIIENIAWKDSHNNIYNLQSYISQITNNQGEIINYFFIFRDIDYQDILEKESQNLEDTITFLIKESNYPSILIDQETKKILLSNEKSQQLFEYTIDRFNNLFLYDLWDLTIEEIDDWITQLLANTSCDETTIDSITKTRSKIQVKFIQKSLPLFDRTCIIFIIKED